jgi:hypothetical protein
MSKYEKESLQIAKKQLRHGRIQSGLAIASFVIALASLIITIILV